MYKKYLLTTLYYISPILPILAIYSSNPDKYGDLGLLVSMILGAVAYTWLIAEFILIARAKFIEQSFGQDKLYRFHGIMAVVSIILAFIHKEIEEIIMGEFLTSDIGELAWIVFVVLSILSLVFMAETILLRIKPILKLRQYAEEIKVSKREYQVLIHNLTVIGLIILFVHVMLTFSAKLSMLVKAVYILYFAIGFVFYIYHKLIKPFILKKNTFVIKNIVKESQNVWTINLLPEKGKKIDYKPGQFGFVRFLSEGLKIEEHPFSISSSPNKEFLSFTIKELGDFTSQIGNLKVGEKAIVDAPYGKFSYLDHTDEVGTVIIVGGVGITPALSMISHISVSEKERPVILIWGINEQSDLICNDELQVIQEQMSNFRFIPVMFKDDTWHGEKGIIDKEKIERLLKENNVELDACGYYVCGPSIMLDNVIKALKSLNIKSERVHYERFSM